MLLPDWVIITFTGKILHETSTKQIIEWFLEGLGQHSCSVRLVKAKLENCHFQPLKGVSGFFSIHYTKIAPSFIKNWLSSNKGPGIQRKKTWHNAPCPQRNIEPVGERKYWKSLLLSGKPNQGGNKLHVEWQELNPWRRRKQSLQTKATISVQMWKHSTAPGLASHSILLRQA